MRARRGLRVPLGLRESDLGDALLVEQPLGEPHVDPRTRRLKRLAVTPEALPFLGARLALVKVLHGPERLVSIEATVEQKTESLSEVAGCHAVSPTGAL